MPEQCLHGKKFSRKILRAKSEKVQADATGLLEDNYWYFPQNYTNSNSGLSL